MSISDEFARLVDDRQLQQNLKDVQNLEGHQQMYSKLLAEGLIQKRHYSLAPVNVLGTNIPGQTTYQVELSK